MAEPDDKGGPPKDDKAARDGHDRPGGQNKGGKDNGSDKPSKPPPVWPWFAAGAVILLFAAVVLWLIFVPNPWVRTDDARVRVHYATVGPRVGGQVLALAVNDNQAVQAGQLLVQLDDRDYRAALDTAQANLQRDEARVDDAEAAVQRQPALIDQSASTVPAAQARLDLAGANARRYRNLASTGAGAEQDRQQADAQLKTSESDLLGARAQLVASRRQLDILRAERAAAEAVVKADQAQLRQAELNLSYTRITAPIAGQVAQRTVQVGDFVAPGAPMMTVLPLEGAYVEAEYREVALKHVRPGQHVRIHVDAYDVWLDGYVQSLPGASGAVFSPVPPENATGNFTKIVQRLPVKIEVSPGQPLARLLRAGFSVETAIDTGLLDVVALAREGRPPADLPPPPAPPPAALAPVAAPATPPPGPPTPRAPTPDKWSPEANAPYAPPGSPR